MSTRRSVTALFVVTTALVGCRDSTPSTTMSPGPSNSTQTPLSVEAWRQKHEADYRRDYSTISGLHAFRPGRNRAGSAPGNDIVIPSTPATIGTFVAGSGLVRFEPAAGASVMLDGHPVINVIDLKDDGTDAATELVIGDVRLVVHLTGDTLMLRVRDPNSAIAKGFLGFSWFPIDDDYRVVGRFIKDASPRSMKVANTYGDLDTFTSEGVVEFALQGQTLRLRPFTTRPGRLYFVFKDASSGQETYTAARFLYADLLADGTAVLDFNMAYNPPCSFNPYTTCSIPLPENRLPIKVLAGEKAYPLHVPLETRAAGAPKNH
jgi:uncharacterized protein